MTDPNPPVTTKQAMPFDNLLVQCRDLVCERLAEALDGMLEKMDGTLSALIFETQDRDLRTLYLETRDKALEQRNVISEQFRAHYLREFKVRSNKVKKIGQSFSDLDSSSLELDLVGEDDLNETLKLKDMANKLRQYCDEELSALDQRVGVLLGDANLEAEDNPFSPQAICDAFKHTCRTVDTNVKVRMVLLKLFDDHVLDDIRPVYKAVNALLVQNSILPKIRFGASRGKDAKAPPGDAAHAADKVPGDGPDFFSVLQELIASNVKAMTQPAATAGTGASAQGATAVPGVSPVSGPPGSLGVSGAPLAGVPVAGAPVVVVQGAELMNLLTRVQQGDTKAVPEGGAPLVTSAAEPGTTNVLRELKATSLGTGMNQLDSMTLDIVAMLFDQLFDDPKIPIAVKGLIGRMQIPMLKVAIADKAFFSRKSHPARALLDTLGEISARLPGDFSASNPVFGRLEGIIQELMDKFQDNMEIFDVVRERLRNLLQEEDRRVEEETQAAAKRIEQNESLAASKTMAEFEVKTRVEAGNLPRPVKEFLMHQWVKPLLIVHVRRGQHSEAWKNSLATMDLLIWSVEAKHTPEERQDLTTVVPELFKRLAAGLKIADVEDSIRERFFSDLKELHSEAMKAGEVDEVAAAHDVSTEDLSAKPDAALAIEFDSVPAAQPDAALVTSPDALPVMPFDVAPVAQPDAAPVSSPDALPVMQFDAAPPINPEGTPAAKPDSALATNPDALPVVNFDAAPPIKPEATPAAKPDAAPAAKPVAEAVAKPGAVPGAKIVAAPTAKPAVAPTTAAQTPKPVAAPMTTPAAATVTKPAAPPTTKIAVPPAKPAAAPATIPAAPTVTKPAAAPATRPAAAPATKPAAVPAAKPGAVPIKTPVPGPRATVPPVPAKAGKAIVPAAEKIADLDSLDFTKILTIKNPFGGGKVSVEELESVDVHTAAAPHAKGAVNEVEFINNLKEGTWVEFRERGEKDTKDRKDTQRPAKLSFISPLRSSFLFVDKMGKTVKECSRSELGRLVRLGMVVVVDVVADEAPLFDRMMAGVIGKLT